jgi:hypothetical protein
MYWGVSAMKIHRSSRTLSALRTGIVVCALLVPLAATAQKPQAGPQVQVSEHVSVNVAGARLLSFESNDASLEKRWDPVAGLLEPSYRPWEVKGGLKQTVSANGIAKRRWQFARVVLVFQNGGNAKEVIHLCGQNGDCPKIALLNADGSALPVWEFLTAGMFQASADFKAVMTEHAKGVLLRKEFKGDLYADLEAGQRTWVAVLFDAATDPGRCSLRVLDKSIPLRLAR